MKTEETKTNMPEGWRMTTLGEVLDIRNGKTRPEDGKKYPVYGGNGVLGYADKYNIDEEMIIIGRVGAYCGSTFIEKGKFWLSDNALGILGKKDSKIDLNFLHYLLKKINLNKQSIGGAQPLLTQGIINQIEVFIPKSKVEQQAIAAVLSSFDDKIELLREQNKTLEAIAQALYKRWFVDFEFPVAEEIKDAQLPSCQGGELKGYKSSGGKMVDSELGEIPAGWRVVHITELFDFIKGVEPGSSNYVKYKMSNNYIPFYRIQNISGNNNMPDIFIEKSLSNEKIFEENDILVSLDGTIGKVFIGGSGSYSSGIRKVISKNNVIGQCLIYCFLKSDYFQNGLILFSSSETTIKHAGKSLEYLKFVYKQDIFEQFTEITNSIFKKMITNLAQIQTLSTLRDALLPKLISGKIRVKTASFNSPPVKEGCPKGGVVGL